MPPGVSHVFLCAACWHIFDLFLLFDNSEMPNQMLNIVMEISVKDISLLIIL